MFLVLCVVCACLGLGSCLAAPGPAASHALGSAVEGVGEGRDVQDTDLCYQALVAWAGGSGNSVSFVIREMLNIYSLGSWAQHPSSTPRLWGLGSGYQASSLLLSHCPLPVSSSEAPLDPRLFLGLLVCSVSFAGFRVLGIRGERVGR